MNNKILKTAYAVFISLLAITLVVFMILHICAGLSGANDKLLLGGYVLMILWALMKLANAIRAIRNMK